MLRLDEGNVVYNNSESLGAIETLVNTGEGFSINLPDGGIVFIPEEDCTKSEKEVFQAYHEFYKATGGLPPVPEPEPPGEPVPSLDERLLGVETELADISETIDVLFGGSV